MSFLLMADQYVASECVASSYIVATMKRQSLLQMVGMPRLRDGWSMPLSHGGFLLPFISDEFRRNRQCLATPFLLAIEMPQ